MKITNSKLQTLIEGILDEVLLPRGGKIGGEHQPILKDKDFDKYIQNKQSGYTDQSKEIFNKKWYERFVEQFGGSPKDVLEDINRLKKHIFRYHNQELGRNDKGIISDIRIELSYHPSQVIKRFVKNYSIETRTDNDILDFIENIFPKIIEDYNFQIRRKKENS
jgi:hypothetical protein